MNEDHDTMDALLRTARVRARVPVRQREQAYEALRPSWRAAVWRRRRRRAAGVLLAASVALAVLVVGREQRAVSPVPAVVAETVRIVGDAWRVNASGAAVALRVGETLRTGDAVRVGTRGGVALRDSAGAVVRIDAGSRVLATEPGRLHVEAGRVYVDTEGARGAAVQVASDFGRVVHRGTQFLVSVSGQGMRVGVRDGSVTVFSDGGRVELDPGQQVEVDDRGIGATRSLATWGGPWRWTEVLVDRSVADGQTVDQLLRWVAHETGHRVDYADRAARDLAAQSRVYGIAGLPPMRALPLGLASAELRYGVVDGTIIVSTVD